MEFPELLKDNTTLNNIVWTQEGKEGQQLSSKDLPHIKPRHLKAREEQKSRTRENAEVYTPTNIVDKMLSEVDNHWNGTEHEYIERTVLEITCGEGAYIVTRYDNTTGEKIPLNERVGILDRKLQVVNRVSTNKQQWISNSIKALQSTYGYEYQGDSLYLARKNVLMTYIEYYKDRFKEDPDNLEDVKDIITWNLWQMDGLTDTIPYSKTPSGQINMLTGVQYEPQKARIKDWKTGKIVTFRDIKGSC